MERVKKENKEKIMDMIEKAGDPNNYETSWDKNEIPHISKKKSNIRKGSLSRAQGARFELKVREDLEEKGRVVDKWGNNVGMCDKEGNEIIKKIIEKKKCYVLKKSNKKIKFEEVIFDKLIPAKRKYNPFKKVMTIGTGFPDFIAIKHVHSGLYDVIGVEVKMNGVLSKIEKEKCRWYLQKGIFPQIWIAKKGKKRGEIEYINFAEKYKK